MLDSAGARDVIARLGGPGALQDAVLAALASILAVEISCFGATVVARGGADERDGRTEEVLATATGRGRAFTAVALVAFLGGTWLLLVTGVALAVGSGSGSRALAATAVQAPAVWLVTALGVACLSVGARWALVAWVVIAVFVVGGQVAELLGLPSWVAGLSPYSHVPLVPAEAWSWTPELVLTALTLAVLGTARWRYGRRDIG